MYATPTTARSLANRAVTFELLQSSLSQAIRRPRDQPCPARPGDIGARYRPAGVWGLAGGAGDEGRHDVGGVAVQGGQGPVVTHGGARVSMTGGFLDVTQRHPCVEGGGDQGVPETVRRLSWQSAPSEPGA